MRNSAGNEQAERGIDESIHSRKITAADSLKESNVLEFPYGSQKKCGNDNPGRYRPEIGEIMNSTPSGKEIRRRQAKE